MYNNQKKRKRKKNYCYMNAIKTDFKLGTRYPFCPRRQWGRREKSCLHQHADCDVISDLGVDLLFVHIATLSKSVFDGLYPVGLQALIHHHIIKSSACAIINCLEERLLGFVMILMSVRLLSVPEVVSPVHIYKGMKGRGEEKE